MRYEAQFFIGQSGICVPKAEPLPRRIKKQVFERDGSRCKACGRQVRFGGNTFSAFDLRPKPGHIDHIFPIARGGQNNEENLRLLCITCNAAKGARLEIPSY